MEYYIIYHPDIVKEDLPRISQNMKDAIRRTIETKLIPNPYLEVNLYAKALKAIVSYA